MAKITDSELLLIAKAPQERLSHYAEGVIFSQRSGKSIRQLLKKIADDRLKLSRVLLKDARNAARGEVTLYCDIA